MKLWWVHNETMIATLMAYAVTGDAQWWHDFQRVRSLSLTSVSTLHVDNTIVPLISP